MEISVYLDMILRGDRHPGHKLALQMSKLLGVPLEEILFPKVKEPKETTETPQSKHRTRA